MGVRTTLYPDPFPYADYRRYTYSMGIASGDAIWVAGQLADEYDVGLGRMVCRGNLVDQARLAFEKVRLILESAGAGFQDIVHQVDYITPAAVKDYPGTLEIRHERFGDDLPATTTVVVNRLLREDSLIEVEVVAAPGPSPRQSFPAPPAPPGQLPTPRAVKKGGLLFITTPPLDAATGEVVGPTNVAGQTKAIFDIIGETLKVAGAAPSDIIRTIDYIAPSGLADYRETAEIRRGFFGGDPPAATGIIVEGLPRPGALLEVSAIVVIGGGDRQTYNPGWPRYDRLTYRPGARKGDLLCLAGLTGADPISRSVAAGDLAAQTRQIYDQAQAILNSAGLSMKNVVKTVDYITPEALPNYRDTVPIRKEFFGGDFPVATGVIVNRLLRPEYLIEIDFTAAVD